MNQWVMRGWAWYGGLLALGAVLYIVCRLYPADLPAWLPWEFSWGEYLATALALGWFVRGLTILPKAQHPPLWRTICFVVGVASFWIVLQTRIDLVLSHGALLPRGAVKVGAVPFQASAPYWASDHAGVVATLQLP